MGVGERGRIRERGGTGMRERGGERKKDRRVRERVNEYDLRVKNNDIRLTIFEKIK